MYVLTGDEEGETRLDEVEVSVRSLRSATSLWLVYPLLGVTYLWHGSASKADLYSEVVRKLASDPPQELASTSLKVGKLTVTSHSQI